MTSTDMQRCRELTAAYGAARQRWPTAEQPLHDRLSACAEGAALLAEAAALDEMLDALQTRPEDPLRAGRILRVVGARGRKRQLIRWVSVAYAASVLLGVSLGYRWSADISGEDGYGTMLIGSTVIEEYL